MTCIVLLTGSCKKFLDIAPPDTSASANTVYTNDAQAAAVLTSVYGKLVDNVNDFADSRTSFTVYTGLFGDEFEAYDASGANFMYAYRNANEFEMQGVWTEIYSQLYVCNAAIEGITASTTLKPAIKKQLLGEAKFMRGFMLFYATNAWGNVPLTTTTDYRTNLSIARSPVAAVYQQVLTDLTEAKELLGNDYLTPAGTVATERVRPNKAAATAMLARVYLYQEQWDKAEAQATELIGNSNFVLLPNHNDIFLNTSKEAIWQLQSISNGSMTHDGNAFIRTVTPNATEPVTLTKTLVDAFATNDKRKTSWVDSITLASVKYYYPKKYKVKIVPTGTPATEYLTVLRLAEQYLIRAEARARQNKLTGANSAESDINAIRGRAGIGNTTATTQPELLAAIEQERRIELFTEWGHRWFDLKRTNRLDAVMTAQATVKGITWNPDRKLFPVPRVELDNNPNMLPQNPGYN